ncbi:MAG: PAS domain S-box protein [Rhodocyclaceae bacterium]|nr:PAS domain S-box protein [Rhodocyclaceae bacterium]
MKDGAAGGGRWYGNLPYLLVSAFALAMLAVVWVLQRHELDIERSSMIRDMHWAEQTMRLRMDASQDFLQILARDLGDAHLKRDAFLVRATQYIANNPELVNVLWVGPDGEIRWAAPFETTEWTPGQKLPARLRELLSRAQGSTTGVYGPPPGEAQDVHRIQYLVPVKHGGETLGTVVAIFDVAGMMRHLVPKWFTDKYLLSITGPDGQVLARNSSLQETDDALRDVIPLAPSDIGLTMRALAYRGASEVPRALPTAMIIALSLLAAASLWYLSKSVHSRRQAEGALRTEYAFRKAMEESVVTGLRAIDLEGRITYVNPAFCRMVGLPEEKLIGCLPPFPYWPPEGMDELDHNIRLTLEGKAPEEGFIVRIQRPDGERFDVRLYVSPLIDAAGHQTGWMAAMNDITEPLRARAELQASHQRFVAVLDGLDAIVFVANAETDEIVFTNQVFRSAFPGDVLGQDSWVVTAPLNLKRGDLAREPRTLRPDDVPCELFDGEVRHEGTGRWYHLRDRAIKWVDGAVARMVIATDITDRRQMDELAARQQERLDHTARLISMGEMASSLAHELNQPLAAIANYSMGCVKRLQGENFDREAVLAAMQKANAQADRAGKIIRRMREFVKKSKPHPESVKLHEIVEETLGLAEIDARKLGISIRCDVGHDLPAVFADRIMIEQVLLNLIRNGMEAMAATPKVRRLLSVGARRTDDGQIEMSIRDRGEGFDPADTERMFSPFFSTKPQGLGMGLNICRSIIEYHRGRLWAQSLPEGGSQFAFTLPLQESDHV